MAGGNRQDKDKVGKDSPKKAGKGKFKSMFSKPSSPVKQPPCDALIKFGILGSFIAVIFEQERAVNRTPYLEWEAFKAATGRSNWLSEYHPLPYTMYYHKDGVKQKHFEACEYHRRIIMLEASLDGCNSDEEINEQLRYLGEKVFMNNLNVLTKPGQPIVKLPLEDKDLVFIRDAVVSEVIGPFDADKVMKKYLGDTLGAFDEHSEYVYRFFRSGKIPKSSQTYLSAPDSECMEYDF